MYLKDFDNWNKKKKEINYHKKFFHPERKEIWWTSVGINIGSEIDGKDKNYMRPVLILNSENIESFFGIPLTSKIKSGKYRCTIKSSDGKYHNALILKSREFDKRRLLRKMSVLNDKDYFKVLKYFEKLYL